MKEKFQSILNVFKNFATSNKHDKFMFFITLLLNIILGWICPYTLNMTLSILILFIIEKSYQYMPMKEKNIFGFLKIQIPDWEKFQFEFSNEMVKEYNKPTDSTYIHIAASILLYTILHVIF